MPYPLPGEQIPIVTGPNGEPIVPVDGSMPTPNPIAEPSTPPKKIPGRLLFDKFKAGETQFTSLRYTDARDGFGKQMTNTNPVQWFPPDDYIGKAPNEKTAANYHRRRIADFFRSSRGNDFLNKQIGLQLSNTRIESLDLFSTTLNTITKKTGLDSLVGGGLGDKLGGIGNATISPSTILSTVNFIKTVSNKKLSDINENDILNGIGVVARKTTRTAISALQNYNFQNTIDQAGTDPNTGWNHYDRFGASNILPDNEKYWYIVRTNNGSEDTFLTDSPSNRLVKLTRELGTGVAATDVISDLADKIVNGKFGLKSIKRFADTANSYYNQGLGIVNALGKDFNSGKDFQPINNAISDAFNFVDTRLALAERFVAPFTNEIIDQYEGGPNSLNGVGPTIIRRYDNTYDWRKIDKLNTARDNSLSQKRNLFFGQAGGTSFGPTAISQQYQKDTGEDLFKDVRREVANNAYDHGRSPNYETIRQTNLPRPRKSYYGWRLSPKPAKEYEYITTSHVALDIPINKKSKTYQYFNDKGKFKAFDRPVAVSKEDKEKENKGVHRIVFTPINPFTGKPFSNTDADGRIIFDAYISNFKDNFTPTWNDINYIGRSETFHTFSRFKRDVSFTLQIPCFNPIQLRNRHRAIYELASINAGSYNQSKLGGVITYLRLGNYLNSQGNYDGEPGIITNFSITVPNDASWDVDEQLAHYLTVDIGFKLIHNSRPERQSGGFIGANIGDPLIGYTDDTNSKLGKSILRDYTNITGEEALAQIGEFQDPQLTLAQSIASQATSLTGEQAVEQYQNEQEFQRQANNQALGKNIQNSIYSIDGAQAVEQANNSQLPVSDDWNEGVLDNVSFMGSDDGYGNF